MANINKGRLLLKLAAKALLMALKKIPVAGAVVEIGVECWKVLRDEQEQCAVDERIIQLEQAAACTPAEAQQVVAEVVQEAAAQGQVFAAERVEAVRDLMAVMPAQIQNRTRATLSHAKRLGTSPAVALPVTNRFADPEREAFYTGLFPQRRPQFRAGDELPGADDWHLERLIGAGGFGEVWLARNGALAWAVKFCQDEVSAKLLLLEKKNLTLLMEKLPAGTANVVALLSTRFKIMPYWLAFEYIDGGTLESRMRLGPMSWPEAWAIFKPLLEGMAHVHKLGIVHRDLKPANILLDAQQRPRIADFGIGKILAVAEVTALPVARRDSTVAGYGTIIYMPPEQRKGQEAHPADDVYALGVILWQMLAGQLGALESDDDIDDLSAPDAIKAVIQECRFRRRDKRPSDAGVLLAQLASMQKPVVQPSPQVQRQPVVQQQVQTPPPLKLVLPTVESIHGWSADKVQALQKRTAEFLQSPVEFQHNLKSGGKGPVMVVIPTGSFMMGSPDNEPERNSNERQHPVTLAKPFAMGKFAVTFADYDWFCEATGNSKPGDQGWGRGRRPVINVSWADAVAYCEWLSEQTGKTYRLPTEAEWEYACRAGTVTPFAWGSTITPKQANYHGNYVYNGGAKGEYRQKTVPVEEFAANAFGLYQMHGNVWEWTSSEYDAAYSGKETTCADKGNSDARAVRGGSWVNIPNWVRAANRFYFTPANRNNLLGFRLIQD